MKDNNLTKTCSLLLLHTMRHFIKKSIMSRQNIQNFSNNLRTAPTCVLIGHAYNTRTKRVSRAYIPYQCYSMHPPRRKFQYTCGHLLFGICNLRFAYSWTGNLDELYYVTTSYIYTATLVIIRVIYILWVVMGWECRSRNEKFFNVSYICIVYSKCARVNVPIPSYYLVLYCIT